MKLDKNLMHVVTTSLNHADYMRYRAAHNKESMTSAAFLRTLVTVGLDECAAIAKRGTRKARLQSEIAMLQGELDAISGTKKSTVTLSPKGRFHKGDARVLVKNFLASNPNASVENVRKYLSKIKQSPVHYSTAWRYARA